MTVVILSIIFLAIIAVEVPALVRNKMWRELTAFSLLFLPGMLYSYGLALNLPLPNPTKGIELIFAPVSKLMEKILS